ncbi:MAG TPA: UDP-glucose 4-epimerase GalE, partial [Vicinamibacteria bacterium]|nr:UDP-glucose 4-epimerase GalE [Vicinamibacteria bacterium]
MTPLKCLVTGGAGYIGSHAARALLEAGHEVRVLDDLSRGHRAAVPPGVELVVGGVGEREACARALEGMDAVLHFAAFMSVAESVREPARYYRANVAEAVTLLEEMAGQGVARMVFSSTCAVYGVPRALPIDEDHAQDPISPYGASKRAFERALADVARAGGLRAIALRYFNAAGCHPEGGLGEDHRPEEHIVPLAVDAALGRGPGLTIHGDDYETPDGTCIRDFIHVDDLARAHVLALSEKATNRTYNLDGARAVSIREIAETVKELVGDVTVEYGPSRPGDFAARKVLIDRAREELGWEPL